MEDLAVVHGKITMAELRAHNLQDFDISQGILRAAPEFKFRRAVPELGYYRIDILPRRDAQSQPLGDFQEGAPAAGPASLETLTLRPSL